MTDCVFCGIVRREEPSEVVGENDRALAFMDINPATTGHTLVIPKAHADDIWDLGAEDGAAVWALSADVATAIREGLRPDGLTMFQANGKVGWQDVFHFHVHLVPRWAGDELVKPWTPSDAKRDGIAPAAEAVRSARA